MIIKLEPLKEQKIDSLQIYCNSRPKKTRIKSLENTAGNSSIYALDYKLRENHNCKPYFITITFPVSNNLRKDWQSIPIFLRKFKEHISKNFLVAGGFISVEAHRNTTLYSKRGKNTKAGTPHLHMVLWLYNEFLMPHTNFIKFDLQRMGLNCKMKHCAAHIDTLRAVLYTVKDANNHELQNAYKQYSGQEKSAHVWANHTQCNELFFEASQGMPQINLGYDETNFSQIPTVRKSPNAAVQLTEFFANVFKKAGYTVGDGWIYKKIKGTRFSWRKWVTLREWVSSKWDFQLPPKYLEMLKENSHWIATQGGVRKGEADAFLFFPEMTISMYYMEFLDGVYALDNAVLIDFDKVAPSTACISSFPQNFQDVEKPCITMILLYHLLSKGEFKAFGFILDALEAIGSTFHPGWSSKQSAGFYLHGPSDTFKSTLIHCLLKAVRPDHIDSIPKSVGSFNLASLKKKNKVPYLWYNDDARWGNIGVSPSELINLLDNSQVIVNEKFMKSSTEEMLGSIVFSSNQKRDDISIYDSNATYEDVQALAKRFREVHAHPLKEDWSSGFTTEQFREALEREAVGLAVLANAFFLHCAAKKKRIQRTLQLPDFWWHCPVILGKPQFDLLSVRQQGEDITNRIIKLMEVTHKGNQVGA